MARPDDFNLATRKSLAQRAGYHCSFPGCPALTIGPSDEDEEATSDTGMACHIAAASGGAAARRYDSDMTTAQRKNIENGLWCCYTHGKLIDTDEQRFTVAMLKEWKRIAERRAQIMQERQCTYEDTQRYFMFRDLVADTLTINGGLDGDERINELLHDCGVPLSWGADATLTVRDLLVELYRNAITHGQAKTVSLQIMDGQITLTDDGAAFNPKLQLTQGNGGAMAAKAILELEEHGIVWACYREHGQNHTRIAHPRAVVDLEGLTPCSVMLPKEASYRTGLKVSVLEGCQDVYLVVPRFISYSDIYGIKKTVDSIDRSERVVTIITQHLSKGVVDQIKKEIPGCRVINIQ